MKIKNLFKGLLAMAAITTFASCDNKACGTDNGTETKGSAEAVIENIMTRTSVRDFTDRQISKDTLETIVKAGMAAPSAMNKQPWAFVVITEKQMLDSLNAVHPYANLKTATAAIVVCGDMDKTIEGEGREYWVQDCSAATENILLAAHAYGIGAVWCGVYPTAERVDAVKKTLGMPENIVPLNIVTMGYPAEEEHPKDKWNADNVHYQKW